MNLFKYELLKLIKRKSFWCLIIGILFINVVFINVEKNIQDQSGYRRMYREEIQETLNTMTLIEASEWLKEESFYYTLMQDYKIMLAFPDTFEEVSISEEAYQRYKKYEKVEHYWIQRADVINELVSYYDSLQKYPSYLSDIKENLTSIKTNPLWMQMSDNKKEDIKYQIHLYDKLENVKMESVNYLSVESFSSSQTLRLLTFMMVCCFAIFIIKDDEEKMQELLSSTTHGHKITVLTKIAVFICVSIISILFIQVVDIVWRECMFGSFDGNVAIQCVPLFYESPFLLTIYQYLLLSMVVFSILITILGLVFMFCYYIFDNKIISFVSYFSVFIIEAILYSVISLQSNLAILSHVNIMRIFEGDFLTKFLSFYHIFSLRCTSQIILISICVLIGVMSVIQYLKLYNHKIYIRLYKFPTLSIKSTSLSVQEVNRILYINKGIVILVLLLCISIVTFIQHYQSSVYIKNEQKYIYQIYEKYEGKIDENTRFSLQLKMDTFTNAEKEYVKAKEAYKNNEISYDDLMEEQINYNIRMKDQTIYSKLYSFLDMPYNQIVYDEGFNAIFSIEYPNRDSGQSIYIILGLLLFISSITYKHKEEEIYLTTYKGGNIRKRITWSHIFTLGISIVFIIELCTFLQFYTIYPMSNFNVSMNQLFMLVGQIVAPQLNNLNAGQYILLLYGMKFFGVFSVCIISTCIFRYSNNRIVGLLMGLAIFFIPMFLYYNGFSFMSHFSIFDVVMGNLFLQRTFSFIKIGLLLSIDIICILLVKKSYVKI